MAEHNLMGKAGEDAAAKYLEKHDYAIRHRNWHYHHLEIDMVAVKDNEIIFVEVKTRKNSDYGEPYEAVDDKKAKYLMRAADTYIKLYQLDNSIRFDILSLTSIDGMQDFEIKHIKEAFYPTMTKSL